MTAAKLLWVLLAALVMTAACGKPGKEEPLPQDVTDFHVLFKENCSGCHGADGKSGAAPPLNNAVYLALIPKDTLRHIVENGVSGALMPAFAVASGGPLYPKQIDAVVDGIEGNWAKPIHLGKATLPPYSETGGDPVHGEQVFKIACAICHGSHGVIGPVTNPTYLSLSSDQNIRTTVIVGRPFYGMPDWRTHVPPGRPMTNEEITDVVAYVSSMRPVAVTSNTRAEGQSK